MKSARLSVMLVLSVYVVAGSSSKQSPTSSRFWSYIFDEFEAQNDSPPDYDYHDDFSYDHTTTTSTTTTTTTAKPSILATPSIPSAESVADKKALFLALDNEGKAAYLQSVLAGRLGDQQAPAPSMDTSLTPVQRKEAFMRLPTEAKIAFLRQMASSSGSKAF